MENQETEFVYLTRVFKTPYDERFEKYISGEDVEVLGKPSNNQAPSSIDFFPDLNDPEISQNAHETAEISSYFFYAPATEEGLNDLRKRTSDLLYTPSTEEAGIKQRNGEKCSSDELYGGEITSMCIIKVPMNTLTNLAKKGMAEIRTGEYGLDSGNLEAYSEIAIGDKGLKQILDGKDNSQVMAYGEYHTIMNCTTIFSDAKLNKFDEEQLFDRSYEPIVNINVFDKIANNFTSGKDKSSYKTPDTKTSELEAANQWFENLDTEGMDEEQLFDRSYVPTVNINVFDKIANNNSGKDKSSCQTPDKKTSELEAANQWFENLDTEGMDEETLALLKDAMANANDYYNGSNDDNNPSA